MNGLITHLRFFMWFGSGRWPWPKPIYLCELDDNPMKMTQYDPRDPRDAQAEMPIITPAYPAMNSSYNVTRCTREVGMSSMKMTCSALSLEATTLRHQIISHQPL